MLIHYRIDAHDPTKTVTMDVSDDIGTALQHMYREEDTSERRHRRNDIALSALTADTPATSPTARGHRIAVRCAFAKMTVKQRRRILAYAKGASIVDIAARENIAAPSVYASLRAGRQILKRELAARGEKL